jgi:L-alanine-DL-glutamate epimerase-like enolase superfamily enzyme
MAHRLTLARRLLGLRRPIASATGGNLRDQERLFAQLEDGAGAVGWCEAAPHPTRGPSIESLERSLESAQSDCGALLRDPTLFGAWMDLQARARGLPLWLAMGWPRPPRDGLRTVVTFALEDPVKLLAAATAERAPALKLKLRGLTEEWPLLVELLRSTRLPIALDPNGSWSRERAEAHLAALEPYASQLLWVEQPCPPEAMSAPLRSPCPILADEAVGTDHYVPAAYDGVVLKPARLGLAACATIARREREENRRVTLGCHLQSSWTSAATLHLAGFVSETAIDLDSVLLVERDPFLTSSPLCLEGRVLCPEAPGVGALPAADLADRLGR